MESETGKQPEPEPQSYCLAARFSLEQEPLSERVYASILELNQGYLLNMNAYRFLLADKGKAISWYIALVGKKPPEDAEQQVTKLLMQGEITQLDERV